MSEKEIDNQELLHNALSKDAFFLVNKAIARKVGVHAALVLADLISKESYFKEKAAKEGKEWDGWFFNTIEDVEYDTTLSGHQQKSAVGELIENNFISYRLRGIPAKRYFKILHGKILNFLQTRVKETRKQGIKKMAGNKNKSIKIKKKNSSKPDNNGLDDPTASDASNESILMAGCASQDMEAVATQPPQDASKDSNNHNSSKNQETNLTPLQRRVLSIHSKYTKHPTARKDRCTIQKYDDSTCKKLLHYLPYWMQFHDNNKEDYIRENDYSLTFILSDGVWGKFAAYAKQHYYQTKYERTQKYVQKNYKQMMQTIIQHMNDEKIKSTMIQIADRWANPSNNQFCVPPRSGRYWGDDRNYPDILFTGRFFSWMPEDKFNDHLINVYATHKLAMAAIKQNEK